MSLHQITNNSDPVAKGSRNLRLGLCLAFILTSAVAVHAQNVHANSGSDKIQSTQAAQTVQTSVLTAEDKKGLTEKAAGWVAKLQLNDPQKAAKVEGIINRHLEAVYSWNKSHDYTEVPAGLNPGTGQKLSELDRKIIVQSSLPGAVHKDLMDGLRSNLSEQQVAQILDEYTIGKVAFTLKGYQAIVPDLTAEETKVILTNLEQAREQAIDFKSMKSISGIFEIYKTRNEQYLNAHGRNWHQLFKNYVQAAKAKKAAAKK